MTGRETRAPNQQMQAIGAGAPQPDLRRWRGEPEERKVRRLSSSFVASFIASFVDPFSLPLVADKAPDKARDKGGWATKRSGRRAANNAVHGRLASSPP